MTNQAIELTGIDNIKTATIIKRIMSEGEEIDRRLVTKVTFEGELEPADIAQIHRLLKSGATVNVSVWSPQLSMMVDRTES